MNTATLHITNGDSTTNYLKSLNFSGDFITWREMLCEGKTINDVGSESFWKIRFDFLKKSYRISKNKFINYSLKEYRKLCQKKNQDEIVLWFEYDLFCQINMIAVISWLKRYRKETQISLVCSGEIQGSNKLYGLPELTKNQIKKEYKNRVVLNQDDIEYADYIWQLYCSDCPLRLETVYKFNPMSAFKYLSAALEVHLKRFPSIKNGLNTIENTILKNANTHQLKSKEELINRSLIDQGRYGFGDHQYLDKINRLKALFSSFNPVKLSRKGKKVLESKLNFYAQMRNDFSYLGGVKKYSYLYHNTSKKLLKITS